MWNLIHCNAPAPALLFLPNGKLQHDYELFEQERVPVVSSQYKRAIYYQKPPRICLACLICARNRYVTAKCNPKKNGCYSTKSVNVEAYGLKRPSCCEGKIFPCCDSSCIDRLALCDCASESESPSFRALQSATDSYTL